MHSSCSPRAAVVGTHNVPRCRPVLWRPTTPCAICSVRRRVVAPTNTHIYLNAFSRPRAQTSAECARQPLTHRLAHDRTDYQLAAAVRKRPTILRRAAQRQRPPSIHNCLSAHDLLMAYKTSTKMHKCQWDAVVYTRTRAHASMPCIQKIFTRSHHCQKQLHFGHRLVVHVLAKNNANYARRRPVDEPRTRAHWPPAARRTGAVQATLTRTSPLDLNAVWCRRGIVLTALTNK